MKHTALKGNWATKEKIVVESTQYRHESGLVWLDENGNAYALEYNRITKRYCAQSIMPLADGLKIGCYW